MNLERIYTICSILNWKTTFSLTERLDATEDLKLSKEKIMNKAIKIWLKLWIQVMCLIAGVMGGMLIQGWNSLDIPTKLLMFLSVSLTLHVLEEWVYPGGFFYMYNRLMGSDAEHIDRYPMSQLTDMLTNFSGQVFFIFFLLHGMTDRLMVLILVFCVGESVVHLTVAAKKNWDWFHNIYNPGFITTLACFVPLGVVTLIYLLNHPIATVDIVLGIVYGLMMALFSIVFLERVFKKKDNPYGYLQSYDFGYYEKFNVKNK